jgi:iron(III) transport system substrate-binding protein
MTPRRLVLILLLLVMAGLLAPSFLVGRSRAGRTLYVVSPHWEGIKYEFGRGFSAWYEARTGQAVTVEWVDVGGTGRIAKYLESEVKRAADSGDPVQIDVVFGGGDYTYIGMARDGSLAPANLPPEIIADIPASYSGFDLRDPGGRWYGAALSTFGIIYNKAILDRRGLAPAREWADLTDTRLVSWVAAADGQSSGSAHTMNEIILQAYGWKAGFGILTRIMGNARYITPASSDIPEDIARGDVAEGLAIDFYALRQVDLHGRGRLGFVVPAKLTIVNADPIAKIARCANPDLADAFIEYVLSEGQKLWCYRRGAPGGPAKFELGRLPVRRALYDTPAEQANLAFNPFATRPEFTYDSRLAGGRREQLQSFLSAAFMANHERLARAWCAVIDAGTPPDLVSQLCDPLVNEADLLALTATPQAKADWKLNRFDQFAAWVRLFRAKYMRVYEAARARRGD